MTEDEVYKSFIRSKPCIARDDGKCFQQVVFCHIKHDGMGGSKSNPVIGNGFPACLGHHTEYHNVGRKTFEARHGRDVEAIANWYAQEFTGHDFLDVETTPPAGAV